MDNPTLTAFVVSYGDPRALELSLLSLRQQSLSRLDLEVLVLRYETGGAGEEKSDVLREIMVIDVDQDISGERDLKLVPQELSMLTRHSEYIIFLMEGDLLSTYFLEAMVNAAEDYAVPLSQVVGVSPSGRHVHEGLTLEGKHSVELSECPVEYLSEPVGKLFKRDIFTSKHFEHIRQAEWLSLQVSLLLHQRCTRFSMFPAAVGATYYQASSKQRTKADKRFNESLSSSFRELQRLQALRNEDLTKIQEGFLSNIETHFMMVVRDMWDPHDNCSALQALAELPLRGLPWEVMDEHVDTLAIVANFAPHAGTAGLVAGKRIISAGKRVDLISSVVSSRKKYKKDLLLTEPYLRNHKVHSPRIRGDDDVDFRHFLEDALSTLQDWQRDGAEYHKIYSRSMMPHSHIVAAAIKRQYPAWRWTAEFSDPNSVDAQGKKRLASFQSDSTFPEFQGWGTTQQQEILYSDLRLYRWAELLPYFFADELLFTNENQKKIMLDAAPAEYRDSVRAKSIVAHHPTLAPGYYELSDADVVNTEGEILLGYFGNFYDTRGLTEIIEALDQLDDADLQRFRLVIYTGSREERIHSGFPARVRQMMNLRPRLDFLTSLATMNRMDYLIVNDADTSASFDVNPFLPSKVSDYLGSNAQVWAVYEEGSILSQLEFKLRSVMGDTDEALGVLQRILANHSNF